MFKGFRTNADLDGQKMNLIVISNVNQTLQTSSTFEDNN